MIGNFFKRAASRVGDFFSKSRQIGDFVGKVAGKVASLAEPVAGVVANAMDVLAIPGGAYVKLGGKIVNRVASAAQNIGHQTSAVSGLMSVFKPGS